MNNARIAVVGLCEMNRGEQLFARNLSIKKHLKSNSRWDNIIFQDKNIPSSLQEKICSQTLDTKFINIWDKPTPKLEHSHKRGSKIGYNGMCLFYSMEIFHYLKGYDFYIRLDSDSVLHSDLNINQFLDKDYTYGYVRETACGHKETGETLPQSIKQYVADSGINILCDKEEINCAHFYTNFLITKLDFWEKPEVVEFFNYIYNQGGIANYRWGDHVIQANALRMFCPKEKIMKLDFKYEHGSHRWKNF